MRLLAAALALCLGLWPAAAAAAPALGPSPTWKVAPAPGVSSGAAVLMDWKTGRVLYQKDAYTRRAPASTTKVLTAILALERGKLTDQVKVSKRAAYTVGSSMYIKPGEVYSLHDLLYGLLLRSGNDAATAIAEHIAGSVENFAVLMNQKAKELGAVNSQFANPHGLTDSRHYSTAYDLALITRHALQNETFRTIVAIRETPLTFEYLHRDVVLHNTNRLLRMMPDADGVKTGTTAAAGACLIASATRDDQKLVAVVLRAGNRWNDAAKLLEWGFTNFRLATLGEPGEVLVEAPVAGGRQLAVPLGLAGELTAVVPRSAQGLPKLDIQVQSGIAAPIKRGQPLGRAAVVEDGKVVTETLLTATADVPKATLLDKILRGFGSVLRLGKAF
jgi:D-alanyl-D-alanine carboxypeptidase (penicillin-binding protein 5/6)